MKNWLLVLTLAAAVAAPSVARAGDAPTTADPGAALKAEGDELFRAKRYEDALAKYDVAYERTKNPALLYNRARALEYMARYPEALASFERFAKEASPELLAKVPGFDALVAEVRNKTTRLSITCNVQDARIVLGSRVLGKAPLGGPVVVDAGKAMLEVSADGYFPSSRELVLPGGGQATVDVVLASRDRGALLVVKSPVEGARVFADGKAAGGAPAELALGAGSHDIRVAASGHTPAETRIVLRAGEQREVTLAPRREAITSQWWFWTGVGVVVVGAATATLVALGTEKDPAKGDNFSPTNVKLPLVRFP